MDMKLGRGCYSSPAQKVSAEGPADFLTIAGIEEAASMLLRRDEQVSVKVSRGERATHARVGVRDRVERTLAREIGGVRVDKDLWVSVGIS